MTVILHRGLVTISFSFLQFTLSKILAGLLFSFSFDFYSSFPYGLCFDFFSINSWMARMDDKQTSWSSYSTNLIKYVKLQIRYQNSKGLIVGPPSTPMHCQWSPLLTLRIQFGTLWLISRLLISPECSGRECPGQIEKGSLT